MANYSLSNFLGTRSTGDRLMFIYNSSGTLVMSIDPYSSSFYNKGVYVYILTDGVVNYNNVLDFDTESDAIAAVGLLNVQKKEFIDDANEAVLQYLSLSGGTVIGDVDIQGILSATTFYGNVQGELNGTSLTLTGDGVIQGDIHATTFYGNGSNLTNIYFESSGGTITDADSLNFYTGATVITPIAGTLYFDDTENALSYKPYTVNNDVTINLGQESIIKVYNNTGEQINNGQVCHIEGAGNSGIDPTIELANAVFSTVLTSTTSVVSGVATHDIPDGTHGFITNFGLVRDIDTSNFTIGDIIYLSDTVSGGFSTGITSRCSRLNKIGRILTTGSTDGIILVDIENENSISTISQTRTNDLTVNNAATGIISFGGLSINTDTTKFDIGDLQGWLADNTTDPENPSIKYINYSGDTGLTPTYLTTNLVSYIGLDENFNILQSTTPLTNSQTRDYIDLGVLVHSNLTNINAVNNQPVVSIDGVSQLYDLFKGLGFFNIIGNIFVSNDGNLKINKSEGSIFKQGSNFETDIKNPHVKSLIALNPVTFRYRLQDSTEYSDSTDINPLQWDNNGVLTTLSNNKFSVQQIYVFSSNLVRIQYGQSEYTSMSDAAESIGVDVFNTEQNLLENGLLRGYLILKKEVDDLSVTTEARFIEANKFGNVSGPVGVSVSNLQKAYNNSTSPEIITDSTREAVTIQIGSGSNLDYALEIQNDSGLTTATIDGEGTVSGTTIYSNDYYANSLQGVSGTFTNNSGNTLTITNGLITGIS